jgi:hypothetical protein
MVGLNVKSNKGNIITESKNETDMTVEKNFNIRKSLDFNEKKKSMIGKDVSDNFDMKNSAIEEQKYKEKINDRNWIEISFKIVLNEYEYKELMKHKSKNVSL